MALGRVGVHTAGVAGPGFLLPASAGTLSGMPLDADLVLRNLAELVTCEPALGDGALGVVECGAVAAAGERIAWVGPESRLEAEVRHAPGAVEIDGRGRVALPGFVEIAHGVRRIAPAGVRATRTRRELPGDRGGGWWHPLDHEGDARGDHVSALFKRGRVIHETAR